MTYGTRKETCDEVKRRHLNELIELFSVWDDERTHAMNISDDEYKKLCEEQLELYREMLKNTFNYII